MRRLHSALAFLSALATLFAVAPSASAQEGAAPQGSVVELVEAGAAPQQALRHRFEAGMTQPIRLRVQSQMRMALGSRVQMVPMPIMRMDIEFGPTTVQNGHLHYPFRITDVGISGGENESMNARVQEQVQGLIGAHGETEIDDRGEVVEFTYELPDDASRELQQQSGMLRDSLTRLLPRFPEEPVGVGGSWRVIDDLPLPNMTVRVGTTYRLVSRHGDRLEIEVSTAVIEDAPNPGHIDVSGSGRLRFELGTLRMIGRVQTVAAAVIRGPQGEMRMRIRTRMQITPR